ARDEDGTEVALKVLKPELTQDPVYKRRFTHEARAAAEVTQPHLVALLDAGEADGLLYVAMRFLPGGSLEERIERDGALSLEDVVRVAREIASALDGLHNEGI